MDFAKFDESNPSFRFVKSFGALTALLDYAGVPKSPFKTVIKEAKIPYRLKDIAKEAYEEGRQNVHLGIRKDNYDDFAKAYLKLQEKMARDLSIWGNGAYPKFKSIKPSELWALRGKR